MLTITVKDQITTEIVKLLTTSYLDGKIISDELLDWMNENGAGIEYLES